MLEAGDRISERTTFHYIQPTNDDASCSLVTQLDYNAIFKDKTVVIVGIPGAFTPVCSSNHIPDFIKNLESLKAKGIDTVAVVSVNDAYVMAAWRNNLLHSTEKTEKQAELLFLADGNATFTKSTGLELDLTKKGMSLRCQRFAAIAKDGVVKYVGSDGEGKEVNVSGVEVVLTKLPV